MEFGQTMSAFCKDLHNSRVALIKVIFFFLTGATSCLYPFLPLYMKSRGLRLGEAAIILGLTPIFSVAGTCLASKVAVRASNVKVLLTALTVLCGVFPLLLLAVPMGRSETPLPNFTVPMSVFCGLTSHPELFLLPLPPVPGHSCHLPEDVAVVPNIKVGVCGHMCAGSIPASDDAPRDLHDLYLAERALQLDNRFFLPDKGFECPSRPCTVDQLLGGASDYENVSIHVATHPHLTRYTIITIQHQLDSPMERIWERCRNPLSFHSSFAWSRIHHGFNCEHHCQAAVESHDLCINKVMIHDLDVSRSFWMLLVIKSVNTLLASLTLALLEASVSGFLREQGGGGADLGRQKTAGLLGKVVLPIAVGFLVDVFSEVRHINFTCLLLSFLALKLVVAACIWCSALSAVSEPQIPLKNVLSMLKNIELDVLLFMAFAAGVFSGYLDHFVLWHLEDIGARMWLLSFSIAVAAFVSLPVTVVAEPVVRKLGSGRLVTVGLAAVGVKLFAYGLLVVPELCLAVELLEPLVGPLFICAVLRYGRNITSKTSGDTTSVLVATAHYGLGRGISAPLIGGLLFLLEVDFPEAAKILGGTALACGVIYYMFWHCCFNYVRQVVPQSSERSQRSRWGSVRYLSFRKNRLRRAAAVAATAGQSGTQETTRPDLVTIEEVKANGTGRPGP
ncbi:Major facilitator superfamily domain-containing protein 6-B [Amphibalanus amphitrite]|uniref:Major facilitator superfamily domain-containing protein 6-B n=1 Tax=Amphibalanus amphitrite TaxID=1232801 RepID=A0A6A4VF00_AMPAM|nr:Major facilitator superfamily domain-containing protein 6-B [Amphibalanus amphitrite]